VPDRISEYQDLWGTGREYELMTEAHAKLSVVGNCSRSSLPVCLGEGDTAGGRGVVSSSRGWGGGADSTQGERIWSSLERQKVERGLLLMIHILWVQGTSPGDRCGWRVSNLSQALSALSL
jgi:hypothetical protein